MTQRLGLFVLTICLMAASAQAQTQRARVTGTVVDPDGRPARRATVLVVDQTAVRGTDVTDSQGRFHVANLAAGRYELRVAMEGFAATPVTIALSPDDNQTVTLALQVSAVSESVVVTAAGRELPRSRVTDSVTVVTADDIAARQFETVADALRFTVPGLGVTATGGRGGQTALFTRGGESDFTLVMIDGVRVNGFGGAFDFAHLPVGDIERIEVVRGPQSAVYGSDAIGGVVQIITKQGGPTRVGGVMEGGTFGTSRLSVNTAGTAGPVTWGAAFEQLDTDGQRGETSEAGETVSNDDYSRRDVSLHGQWRGERGTTVRSVFRYGTNERGFPGPWGSDPGGTFAGVDTLARGTNDNRLVSVGVSQRLGTRVDQRVELSHTQTDSGFVGPFGASDSDASRLTFRARTDATLSNSIVATGGFDIQQEQAGNTFIKDASFTEIPVDRRMFGFFGELRFDPTNRLSVTAGMRGDRITREGLLGDGFGRPTFGDETEVAANPKVSLGWYVRPTETTPDWTRLRVSAATGIRPPSAFEIAFTDNPALKSERTRSVDAGVEQALAGGRVLVEATAFFNRYDDLIVSVGQSFQNASQFRTDNLSNSQARGLEFAATGRTPQGFEARATYTWLHTEILAVDSTESEAPGGFSIGDALLRRPRHQGSVELSFTQPVFSVFTSIGTRSATLDVDPSFGSFGGFFDNPGYAVVNLGGSVHAWTGVEVTARVQNLLDRRYEEAFGFPTLGRSVMAGIRVR
jgi:outer membrane cobalamin receptor